MVSAPFGIQIHSPISDFEILEELADFKFRVRVPKPHPHFDDYIVQATPTLGVVWIKANAPERAVDPFGHSLQTSVEKIRDQLSLKYGAPEKSDFLLGGSIWSEAQDWMMGVSNGERFYSYIWKKNLPSDLATVYVGAIGYSSNSGAITLEYASIRADEAESEVDAALSDLL